MEKDKIAWKNWEHEVGEKRGWGRGGRKGGCEENLREWDRQDGEKTDIRARKEVS